MIVIDVVDENCLKFLTVSVDRLSLSEEYAEPGFFHVQRTLQMKRMSLTRGERCLK
jgi:hypothetical protein